MQFSSLDINYSEIEYWREILLASKFEIKFVVVDQFNGQWAFLHCVVYGQVGGEKSVAWNWKEKFKIFAKTKTWSENSTAIIKSLSQLDSHHHQSHQFLKEVQYQLGWPPIQQTKTQRNNLLRLQFCWGKRCNICQHRSQSTAKYAERGYHTWHYHYICVRDTAASDYYGFREINFLQYD